MRVAAVMTENVDSEPSRLQRHRLLRGLGLRRGASHISRPVLPPASAPPSADGALPGSEVGTPYGGAWVRECAYALESHPELARPLGVEPEAWAALGRDDELLRLDPRRAAFIDTETTGLSIGAGTYTFMIGIGTYEGDDGAEVSEQFTRFVVRQYFMRNPAEERAQLHLVEEALSRCSGIVSFNGVGFDMPLIESRLVLARIPHPLPGAPHLDLLPPARRLWSARLPSCRLGSLEQEILCLHRSEEDVPGWLIPTIYREYYQTGVVSDLLTRVFYHNLLDITSMPALAGIMAARYQLGSEPSWGALHPTDCASLARSYEHLGWIEASEQAYRKALGGPLDDAQRARVYQSLASLLKRQRRNDEAAAVYEEWITTSAGDELAPYIELAKYYEWHRRDLAIARGWAAWALDLVNHRPAGIASEDLRQELERRVARLERKLAVMTPTAPDRPS